MKKRNVAIGLVVLLVLAAVGWAFWPAGPDPQMAKVEALREQAMKAAPEQRRAAFEALGREFEKLTPEQREELMRKNPPPFVREMEKTVREFASLPADKQREVLDKHIDRMEARRKEFEKRRAAGGGPGGGGPGGGGPGGGGPGGPRPGGPGQMAGMDAQRRQEMQKRMLDRTSPDDRARWGNFMRQVAERRAQRGLPPTRGPF